MHMIAENEQCIFSMVFILFNFFNGIDDDIVTFTGQSFSNV